MCDDDFEGDSDGDFEEDSGDDFEGEDHDYDEEGAEKHEHETDEAPDLHSDGGRGGGFPRWQDWMIIGPLSEEIAREEKEKKKIERDMSDEDDQ